MERYDAFLSRFSQDGVSEDILLRLAQDGEIMLIVTRLGNGYSKIYIISLYIL